MPTKIEIQFDNYEQQHEAATLGMWTFLATEVLFFGGLFLAYIVYRTTYAASWREAAHELNLLYGTVNTAILLTSSLTMALAVEAAQKSSTRKRQVILLLLTALGGLAFMGVKGVEYYEDYLKHLVPGTGFVFHGSHPEQAQLFFYVYFAMTGLHALHLSVGIILVLVMSFRARRGDFTELYYSPLEVTGLYWHFVDVIWIFLYPLLYLFDRYRP